MYYHPEDEEIIFPKFGDYESDTYFKIGICKPDYKFQLLHLGTPFTKNMCCIAFDLEKKVSTAFDADDYDIGDFVIPDTLKCFDETGTYEIGNVIPQNGEFIPAPLLHQEYIEESTDETPATVKRVEINGKPYWSLEIKNHPDYEICYYHENKKMCLGYADKLKKEFHPIYFSYL